MAVEQDSRKKLIGNWTRRLWSRCLRDRGVQARAAATDTRAARAVPRHGELARVGRPADRSQGEGGLPPLGEVTVLELLEVLVDVHGLGVVQAVRSVARGLYVCGYPADHDRVVAADAFDIVDMATRHT